MSGGGWRRLEPSFSPTHGAGPAPQVAARVLKRVGAERIDVLALARVTDPPSCCFDLEFPCLFGYLP